MTFLLIVVLLAVGLAVLIALGMLAWWIAAMGKEDDDKDI